MSCLLSPCICPETGVARLRLVKIWFSTDFNRLSARKGRTEGRIRETQKVTWGEGECERSSRERREVKPMGLLGTPDPGGCCLGIGLQDNSSLWYSYIQIGGTALLARKARTKRRLSHPDVSRDRPKHSTSRSVCRF